MARHLLALLALFGLSAAPALAQAPARNQGAPDTLRTRALGAAVVTATRTARPLQDVPVPTTVVSREAIAAQGALRLADVLAEVPGLALFEDHGTGVQLQGLGPEYTLVLLDGQPVIGRTAGTLSLSRLAVTGVDRVEVVRGPTSSRYGSEALAGVVNLVTRRPRGPWQTDVSARAESAGVTDLSVTAEGGSERLGARVFFNRYGSAGYDLTPDRPGTSAPRFSDYAADLRLTAAPSERLALDLQARLAEQSQQSDLFFESRLWADGGQRSEWSLAPRARYQWSPRASLNAEAYAARYLTHNRIVETGGTAVFDEAAYDQGYYKAEAGVTLVPSARVVVHAGGGGIAEAVGGDRYAAARESGQGFAYAEAEWAPSRLLDVNASARYDAHADYASQLSPRLALLARPVRGVRVRGSVGSGYKAPAFRQRYLSFTNAAAGYTVFGSEEVVAGLDALQSAGALAAVLIDPATLGSIRAENSLAYALGAEADGPAGLTLRVGLFQNNVRDLIETQPVATKTNGQSVFSYFNLARVTTRGAEVETGWRPSPALDVSASYQLLSTADGDVLDALQAGALFRRDAAGQDVRVSRADYGGLFGRSRHSGTLKATVQSAATGPLRGFVGSARIVWRGRYGWADANGNGVLDEAREYAPGHALVHLTATQPLGAARLTFGVRNLLGFTDAERLPTQPGRVVFAGAGVRF